MATTLTYPPGLQAAAAELGVQLPKFEKFKAKDALLELSEAFDDARMNGEDDWSDFGGFSLKKLARGIGRGVKGAVRGVGRGVKSVMRNPVVQVLNPAAALAVHTTDKALGGKGVIKGPVGKIVDTGTSVVMSHPAARAAAALGPMAALGKKFGVPQQIAQIAKQVAPHTGITGGRAVAFAIPSRTIPLKQAMAGADKLLGDHNIRNARAVVRNTQALAALGDPAAKRGLAVLHAVGHIRVAKATPPGKKAIPTPLTIPPAALTVHRDPTQIRQAAKKKVAQKPKGFWSRVVAWFKG